MVKCYRQIIIESIDILIVTALTEEFDALASHFQFKKVSSEHSSNFYFLNTNDKFPNSIAVICIRDMGNVHAGVTTASAIHDLRPSYVIMFGLAGSLDREELPIGGVAIPSTIFYAEMGKEKTGEIVLASGDTEKKEIEFTEVRPRSIHIHTPFLQMFKDYVHRGLGDVPYKVQVGIFAITDKVIANSSGKERLHELHPKSLAVDMESYGVGYAVAFFKRHIRFIAVRGISDYADRHKGDSERKNALTNAAAVLIGFLRKNLLSIDAVPSTRNSSPATVIAIQHLSLNAQESIDSDDLRAEAETKPQRVISVVVNQIEFIENGSLVKPEEALKHQVERINTLLQTQKEYPDAAMTYLGLAHVPLIFHLGNKLFRRSIETYGNDHITGTWFKLHSDGIVPKISTEINRTDNPEPSNDVIVRMSVSYPVKLEQIEQIPENPLAFYHIYHDTPLPNLEITDSQPSVDAFVEAFQSLREQIVQEFPTVERIHLFYAGAPTVAFRCGQLINSNTDPAWIVYNYSRKDTPNYGWAINLQTEEVVERRT